MTILKDCMCRLAYIQRPCISSEVRGRDPSSLIFVHFLYCMPNLTQWMIHCNSCLLQRLQSFVKTKAQVLYHNSFTRWHDSHYSTPDSGFECVKYALVIFLVQLEEDGHFMEIQNQNSSASWWGTSQLSRHIVCRWYIIWYSVTLCP